MNRTRRIRTPDFIGPTTIMLAAMAVAMIVTAMLMASCSTPDAAAKTGQSISQRAQREAAKAQRAAEEARRATEVAQAVNQRCYTINASMAHPLRGRMVPLSGLNTVEVRGDSVFSYLPYFGRAYRAPIVQRGGLDFDGLMTGYVSERAKKDMTRIDFDVRNRNDALHYRIEVFDNGRATIDVRSNYRDPISFDGEME